MSGPLVPAAARDLGSTASLPDRPTGDADALVDLLDRILSALADAPAVDERQLPEDLTVGWAFTADWLSEAMPTFAAVTPEAVARRLGEQGTEPSAALVDAVGRFWIRWLLTARLWRTLSALDDRAPIAAPQRLLDLARRWVPRIDPVMAGGLVDTVAAAAGARAVPLLERFASASELPEGVRGKARAELHRIRSTHPA
jgi:hypothetical protein